LRGGRFLTLGAAVCLIAPSSIAKVARAREQSLHDHIKTLTKVRVVENDTATLITKLPDEISKLEWVPALFRRLLLPIVRALVALCLAGPSFAQQGQPAQPAAPAQPAQPADLKKSIEDLVKTLGTMPGPSDDLKKSLADLRTAISVLEDKGPDAAMFTSRADELRPLADYLTKNPDRITPAVATAIDALLQAIDQVDRLNPTLFVLKRSKSLTAAIEAVKGDIIKTYPDLRNQAVALLAELELLDEVNLLAALQRRVDSLRKLAKSDDVKSAGAPARSVLVSLVSDIEAVEQVSFLAALQRRAGVLTALLSSGDAKAASPPGDTATVTAATALQTALLTYLQKNNDPKVDILYAAYGDLRAPRSAGREGRRVCDATFAMQKHCQNQTSCKLPPNAKTALCGYDPVPYADDRNKGARVHFRCVDSLLNPHLPPALPSMSPDRGNTAWVLLQSESQEFNCQTSGPQPPATQPAAGQPPANQPAAGH
jgi:hypothetical protein